MCIFTCFSSSDFCFFTEKSSPSYGKENVMRKSKSYEQRSLCNVLQLQLILILILVYQMKLAKQNLFHLQVNLTALFSFDVSSSIFLSLFKSVSASFDVRCGRNQSASKISKTEQQIYNLSTATKDIDIISYTTKLDFIH